MARLSILSNDEYDFLFKLPKFTDEERSEVFSLDSDDLEYINDLKDPASQIHYILQMGYFKSKRLFFKFTFQQARSDVWFIINRKLLGKNFPKKNLARKQISKNQKRIRDKYGFSYCSVKFLSRLRKQAELLAKRDVTPRFIFDELIYYIQLENVIQPGYSTLQNIISMALKCERNRLCNKLNILTDKETGSKLKQLLKEEDLFYKLTLLKKDPKDFSTSELRKEVRKLQFILQVFIRSKEIIPSLDISNKNICYYAELVQYYPVYKLARMPAALARLYLFCFVHYRFKQINDNLVLIFIYRGNKYVKSAEDYCKKKVYEELEKDDTNRKTAGKLLQLFTNSKIPDTQLRLKAFEVIEEDVFNDFVKKVAKPQIDKIKHLWDYYQSIFREISLNLRPLFSTIEFLCDNPELNKAVQFLRNHLSIVRAPDYYNHQDVPMGFFPMSLRRHIYEDSPKIQKRVNISRYEFLVYLEIKKALESGKAFVKDSINYYRLEDKLIPKDIWSRDKNKILKEIGTPLLITPIENILTDLNKELTNAYTEVNKNIRLGTNKHIKLNSEPDGSDQTPSWRLPYKKEDDGVNNPFYEKITLRNVSDILQFVSEQTSFMDKFTHIQPRYNKKDLERNTLTATLIAKGTGMGIIQMAEICDMKESSLRLTENCYMQLENIRKANIMITNKMFKLPIFKFYSLSDYGVHASIDGQKFETKKHTIKARYSPKYFGLKKGVVSLTLLANHALIKTGIIGANDYEGHALYDFVYNNRTDIEISAVSGDMHSVNRVNFALLYLFGYQFMPRLTKLNKKAVNKLVSFQTPKSFEDEIIRPAAIVNNKLITAEWDNVLRILASLGLKKTTQASMVKKLASYDKSNPTLKAMAEFDKIIHSLYVLNYIDDPVLRRNVHRSLNRGESYHQLKSAIIKVSGRKIIGRTEMELNINNECAALLANSIIYYNASILSELLNACKKSGNVKKINLIKRLSPVAWQHINLLGKYEFCTNRNNIDIQMITGTLLDELRNSTTK